MNRSMKGSLIVFSVLIIGLMVSLQSPIMAQDFWETDGVSTESEANSEDDPWIFEMIRAIWGRIDLLRLGDLDDSPPAKDADFTGDAIISTVISDSENDVGVNGVGGGLIMGSIPDSGGDENEIGVEKNYGP